MHPFARRPEDRPHKGFAGHRITLTPEFMARLERSAQARNLSLFQLMFGTFGLLLARAAGAQDLILGSALANRSHCDWECMIGMLVNVIPVRLRVQDGATIDAALLETRDALLDALGAAELPYSRICEAAGWGGTRPLIEAMFSFHSSFTQRVAFNDLQVDIMEALGNDVAKFPLDVVAIPDNPDGSCDLLIEFDAERYSLEQMTRLADAYQAALALLKTPVPVNRALLDALIPAAAPPALDFPADGQRGTATTRACGHINYRLDATACAAVATLAGQGISVDAIVLAAWSVLLARLAHQTRVTVGLAHAGQTTAPALTPGDTSLRVTDLLAQAELRVCAADEF